MQEHLTDDVWKGVSPAAKHLVSKLLVVAPEHRITVGNALSHNWMKGIDEADSPTLSRQSSSDGVSSGATLPADEIGDFSDEDEWTSRRRAAQPTGGPEIAGKRQRVKGQLELDPRSAQALRPAPLQGRGVNAQKSRQAPAPPPASKPPQFNNNNRPPQFKVPQPKPTQRSAKPAANMGRVNPLGFLLPRAQ